MKKKFENLKSDLFASVVVFFVALPLCLGIALASGAPLFSGIIAGIIGGIVVGAASGSALGVSGPAAGLAVLVLTYIAELGSWESFLLAVVIAGIIQLIAGFLKLGTIAYYFPSSVIKGMLAGIGIIIAIKQFPHALGYNKNLLGNFFLDENNGKFVFPEILQLGELFDFGAILISAASLSLLIFWEGILAKKFKIFKAIPAPFGVVALGILFFNLFEKSFLPFHLEQNQIVQIPTAASLGEFFSYFSFPDFSQLKNPQIYSIAAVIALIASIETLLSLEAADKMDPQKRVSPGNRELKAQGLGNIISGLVGGLPITQVIVRSSANITFGAKTKISAIAHGFLLFIAVIFIPRLLNMIPLASLSCVLFVVGFKLAKPEIFKKNYHLGLEQFLPFIVTVLGVVFTDLLEGVMMGIVAAIYFILHNSFKNPCHRIKNKNSDYEEHFIRLAEEVSFLNKGKILQMLAEIPPHAKVKIDGSRSKTINYDIIEILRDFKTSAKSKQISLTIEGFEHL